MDAVEGFVRAGWIDRNRVVADRLGLVYCEGWVEGRVVGLLRAEQARERDAAGEPYAAVILAGDRVVAYAEIAWSERFARCWQIDRHDRRWQRIEYRRLADGRLFLIGTEKWAYGDTDQPEFDISYGQQRWSFTRDGRAGGEFDHGRGGRSSGRQIDIDPDGLIIDWTPGDWATLCGLDTEADLRELPDPEDQAVDPVIRPWRPPEPLRPQDLTELFTPGTRFELRGGQRVTVEVSVAGSLRLGESGVVIADHAKLRSRRPLRVDLPGGVYRVELARFRYQVDRGHLTVAAAKLVVSDERPAVWEMACRDGDDPVFLGDGEMFGFGVDSGVAAFADADSTDAVAKAIEEAYGNGVNSHTELDLPGVVVFLSGWGDGAYPAWVGRDRHGAVCAVVADFLLTHEARVITACAEGESTDDVVPSATDSPAPVEQRRSRTSITAEQAEQMRQWARRNGQQISRPQRFD